jgi:signal transduction histidine kinase
VAECHDLIPFESDNHTYEECNSGALLTRRPQRHCGPASAEFALADYDGDGDHVALTVHNHGTPVPEPDRARIFEPLVQVAETSSESAGTTFVVNLARH